MKRISSKTTYFRKKILPIILLIHILVVVSWVMFFDYKLDDLFFPISVAIIFGLVWTFKFRKLEVVYLGNKYLEINHEKVLFENIISIIKKSSLSYELTYEMDYKIKSILFMVDSFPTYPSSTPDFIKEIKEFLEKNNIHKNR